MLPPVGCDSVQHFDNWEKTDKYELLISLRLCFAFGVVLGFCELLSEALHLPEASEGIWRSWLVVMVKVIFIWSFKCRQQQVADTWPTPCG